MRILFIVFFSFVHSVIGFTQTFVITHKDSLDYPAKKAEYFEDKTGGLTFEQVQTKRFTKNTKTDLNFGFSSSTFWVRLTILNNTEDNHWVLLSKVVFHDYLDFWMEQEDGKWSHIQTGWQLPYDSRESYSHTGFAFPLNLSKNKLTTIYLKVSSRSPLTIPLELMNQKQLDIRYQYESLIYGIFFGILLVMMFYNLFLWFSLKDINYLYYILYIFCTFTLFATTGGFLFKFLHPNSPEYNLHFMRLSMGLFVVPSSLFTIYFLDLKKYSSLFYYLLVTDIIITIPIIILTELDIYTAGVNNLIAFHSPILLLSGIVVWLKGNSIARYYVFAWSCMLIGGVAITLRNAGFLPVNIWTSYGAEIGVALEVTLVSLALGDRYRLLREEKEVATQKALDAEREAKEELEKTTALEQRLLRTQMNPHFIFNSLIAIQNYIYQNKASEAGQFLAKFSQLMRSILESSRQEYISLEEEIKLLENYLTLQQLRFEDKFTYEINIDSNLSLEEVAIPPMLAQPFLENSIEHGFNNLEQKGKIEISFTIQDDKLRLEIEDNGIGLNQSFVVKHEQPPQKTSLATQITQERMFFFNKKDDKKLSLNIQDRTDIELDNTQGTVVSLIIPLKFI